HDLTALRDADREAEAHRLASDDARRPFDIVRGPVLRASLLRLQPEQHALVFNVHHIAFDGWSLGVFLHELAALYRSSPLAELPVQYTDFGLWQRQWLEGAVRERLLAYWRRQLEGLPVLELPCDRPRPAVQGFRGALETFRFEPALADGLRKLSQARGTTLFMTLLAGFEVLLGRYAGQEDFAVGSVVANRNRAEIEDLV
ncbi:MAG: non-ribosomal peptide synthetase, partial [bacterium]|nr:non-ribosomal peptide synthetase [bacterium]